jgi:hypothetical protein
VIILLLVNPNIVFVSHTHKKKLLHLLHGCDPYRYKEDHRIKEKYRFKSKPLQRLLAEAKAEHFSLKFADE